MQCFGNRVNTSEVRQKGEKRIFTETRRKIEMNDQGRRSIETTKEVHVHGVARLPEIGQFSIGREIGFAGCQQLFHSSVPCVEGKNLIELGRFHPRPRKNAHDLYLWLQSRTRYYLFHLSPLCLPLSCKRELADIYFNFEDDDAVCTTVY